MTTKDTAEPGVRAAFAAQLQAMTAHDTVALGALLGEEMTLTHMGGHVQPRAEWLGEIGRGLFVYHDIDVESVSVEVVGRTAHLVGRTRTDATVYGAARRGACSSPRTTAAPATAGSSPAPSPPPGNSAQPRNPRHPTQPTSPNVTENCVSW